jgi:hypothetical protein
MATIIDEVVNVTITRDSVGITRADFGTILIIGDSQPGLGDVMRTYTSLTDVLEDYEDSDDEYIMASKIFAQAIKTDKIRIGQLSTGPAETFLEAYNRFNLGFGDQFYAVVITSTATPDILSIAAAVETDSKIFAVVSSDPDIKSDIPNNVLDQLYDLGYNRTFLMFVDDNDNWVNAAWLGRMLPLQPGSATWAYKDLVGVSDRSILNSVERNNVKQKNGNYYTNLAGANVTFIGVMVSGEYIDVIHGLDWLEAFIQENIAQLLISAPKIPYNNNGIGLIENSLRASLQEAVNRGIINQDFIITVPDILTVSPANKADRLLSDVKFIATLTGAIQNIVINGSVTV